MADLQELARSIKEKEAALAEDYRLLSKLGNSEVAKKLIESVLQHQKLQVLSLDLLSEELPQKFLDFGQITADDVNLRQGPGGSHPLVGSLAKGDEVIIQEVQRFWVKVSVPHGPEGWVFSDYVRSETGQSSTRPAFSQ